jgi:sterol 3beta-glucosyltransferase
MNILLMTYGSRGDVEPFLALAAGFAKAGHTARLAAPEAYAGLAAGSGVEYIPLPGDPATLVETMTQRAGGNPLRMVGVMARFVMPIAASVFARLRELAPGSDAIVHSFLFTHAGYELAKSLGVPDFSAQMFPMFAPTAAFAAPAFPELPLSGIYRRITHTLTNGIFRHGGGILYGQVRRRHPEFPPLTGWPFAGASGRGGRRTSLLFGFSRHVVPPPPEWTAGVHVTGYWQLDPPREDEIPAGLRRFLESGPPPVYIGFGSANPRDIRRLEAIAREAVQATGQRCVLSLGGGKLNPEAGSGGVFAADSIPHRWLFPRTCVVVHHGGAGTTGAGLRAGIPNILIPHTADQPFWANRVRRLGAGPAPIPPGKLTAGRLAAAIDESLHDAAMRTRCRELGEKIDTEDGVGKAVRIVEQGLPKS